MSTADLLFELGCEELPAAELTGMARSLHDSITSRLQEQQLSFAESRRFATPRRLAVLIREVALAGSDIEREISGPPLAAARNDQGEWTQAALGFARKQGIDASELVVISASGGDRVGARITQRGAVAKEILPDIIAKAVGEIPVSKRMRWGRSRHEFLRPVQWLLLLLGEEVVPLELFGLRSDRTTRGHRFHHPEPISIARPGDYESRLLEARVIADPEARRSRVADQVKALAQANESVALADDLLDEVAGLVEWPVALRGSFSERFLEVPSQALISAMKTHQKYFHLNRSESGELIPAFITVANLDSGDEQQVIAGNEKVIQPRLSDAAFFFANDKNTTLASRQSQLAGVVFQNQLGSLLDKTRRVSALAGALAEQIGAERSVAERAAELCKCDLVSEMVLEFPELQGVAGAHYARHDGEPDGVATAIEEHYQPRFAGDELPTSAAAKAVALADRLDTLTGIFGIGQPPTGSKDPFALRRASLGVIRILLALGQSVDLSAIVDAARRQYGDIPLDPDTQQTVCRYLMERLDAWYQDQGIHIDVVRAVLATGQMDLFDIDLRVRALAAFALSEQAPHLAAANKRVANILAKDKLSAVAPPQRELLTEPAEEALFDALQRCAEQLAPQLEARDYQQALAELATLREPIDQFFQQVMVNVDDAALRDNRIGLLGQLRGLFSQIADLALLSATAE